MRGCGIESDLARVTAACDRVPDPKVAFSVATVAAEVLIEYANRTHFPVHRFSSFSMSVSATKSAKYVKQTPRFLIA